MYQCEVVDQAEARRGRMLETALYDAEEEYEYEYYTDEDEADVEDAEEDDDETLKVAGLVKNQFISTE